MSDSRLLRSIPALLGAFVIASCSDSGAPSPTAPIGEATGPVLGLIPPRLNESPLDATGVELKALWWQKKHKGVRVSNTVNVSGGTISIPETGLTMVFPPGAVAAPITITITADPEYVAYKMEPSGTRFLKDVTVTQMLAPIELSARPLAARLLAAYIADDKSRLKDKVPVSELEPSQTVFSPLDAALPIAQVWIIKHFSRYMLSSG